MKLIYLITVILVFAKATVLNPMTVSPNIYFGWFGVVGLVFIFKRPQLSRWTLVLLCIALISIVYNINIIAEFRNVWLRLFSFFILMLSIGSLLRSEGVDRAKTDMFTWLNYTLVTFVVGSFILITSGSNIAFSELGTRGLFQHSMTLSSLAAVAALFSLNKFMSMRTRTRWIYMCLSVICIFTSLYGASRGAFGALSVSLLFYIYFCFYGRIGRLMTVIIITSAIALSTTSLWSGYFDNILTKQANRVQGESLLSGRDVMWRDRIDEFEYSPLIGIGFENVYSTENSLINVETGQFESGSGWLTVLSSMGLLGLFTTIMLFFGKFRYLFRYARERNYEFIFYCSLIVFHSIFSLVEGYIFGVGGILSLFMWISIAMINKKEFSRRKKSII